MEVICPHCQAKLRGNITPEMAGKRVRCAKCKQVFALPQVPQAPAEAPPLDLSEEPSAEPAAEPPAAPGQGAPSRAPRVPGSLLAARRARAAEVESPMKRFAAGAFVAALLCFLLPFFHISCAGNRILTLKGLTLVTGGTAELSSDMQEMMKGAAGMPGMEVKGAPTESEEKVDPEPWAIAAAGACVLGLALSFVKGRPGACAGIAAAVGAVVLLLALMWKLDADVKEDAKKQQGGRPAASAPAAPGMPPGMEDMGKALEAQMQQQVEGMIKVEAAMGFMLAVALLAAAGVLHVVAFVQMKGAAPPAG